MNYFLITLQAKFFNEKETEAREEEDPNWIRDFFSFLRERGEIFYPHQSLVVGKRKGSFSRQSASLCSTEAKVISIDWWSKISCVTHLYGPSDYKKSWVLKICRRKFFFIFEDTEIERALLFSKSIFKQVFVQFLVLLM